MVDIVVVIVKDREAWHAAVHGDPLTSLWLNKNNGWDTLMDQQNDQYN